MQFISGLEAGQRVWVEEGSPDYRTGSFKPATLSKESSSQKTHPLLATASTWLLAPIAAPDFIIPQAAGPSRTLTSFRGQRILLTFSAVSESSKPAQHPGEFVALTVTVDDSNTQQASDAETCASVYNLLYRYMFDRHRNMSLPTSFLIDNNADIVKIYHGAVSAEQVAQDCRTIPATPAQRLTQALPFPVVTDATEFRRNHLALGSVFFQHGYHEQSAVSFKTAVADDPNSAEAHYGLGSACLKLNKMDEAHASFERATKYQGAYPDTVANAWNNLGLLATQQGDTAAAIPLFERALKANPGHFISMVNLGNAYRQQKRWDDARVALSRALATQPGDAEANYSLGMVYAQIGDTAQALEHLQKALLARPSYPEALNNLGVLYLRTERRNQAVATFEECIRVAPTFEQSYINLGRVYALEGDAGKARTVLQELIRVHPDSVQAQSALAALP